MSDKRAVSDFPPKSHLQDFLTALILTALILTALISVGLWALIALIALVVWICVDVVALVVWISFVVVVGPVVGGISRRFAGVVRKTPLSSVAVAAGVAAGVAAAVAARRGRERRLETEKIRRPSA